MGDVLLSHEEDGVLTLTLNRPKQLNAITWPMMGRLLQTLRIAAADPRVRVVILTGAGRGFCAGGDIRGTGDDVDDTDPLAVELAGDQSWESLEVKTDQLLHYTEASVLLHEMPKVTIAMIRGPVAGAGLGLAAACDLRIVSKTAIFTTAYAAAARSGDFGCSYFLTHLVGMGRARELMILGERFGAEEADRIGLVTRLVEDGELEAETRKLAGKIARGPSVAYRYMKRNLNQAETAALKDSLAHETANHMRCRTTQDAGEVALAFKEKRLPIFNGR